jgi:hypothetical protein
MNFDCVNGRGEFVGGVIAFIGIGIGHHKCRDAGLLAGFTSGYASPQIGIGRNKYRLKNLIWALMTGEFPKGEIYFKDGYTQNLKWENLTDVNPRPRVLGVTFSKQHNKWRVTVKRKHKGIYASFDEACRVSEELHKAAA